MWIDDQFWSFLVAITLLTVSPGVDTLLVIRNTARGGIREGILTSLAISCGLFVHAGVSALGISLILLQSAWAFGLLKLAGAAYLIWLGVTSLLAARRGQGLMMKQGHSDDLRMSAWRPLREGFLSNVLNPKTVIFYMAFLPQFIAPGDPALAKSLWLASIHFLIANVWQVAIAMSVGTASGWLGSPLFARWLNGVTGTVLVALGVKLALQRLPG